MANVKKGKSILHVDERGEVAFIDAKVGKRTKRFHRREYPDGQTMAKSLSAWMKGQGVTSVASQTRVLTGEELMAELIDQQMSFAYLIETIADEAQGLETWDDFDTDVLTDLTLTEAIHLGYVALVFSKIKQEFTPAKFCELAETEDDPQYVSFDPNNSPMNYGFDRIKDAVFDNTRADRMRSISFGP